MEGIRVILIQWPHHARIIYLIVGRKCNKSLQVREELLGKTVDTCSIGQKFDLADELVNVCVFMDSEGFHVLHLGNLRQNVNSELVEHHIIRILHIQIAVTSNILTRMILLVVEHTT